MAALTLLTPVRADAACACGFQDGVLTTHTGITLDGNLADWAPVHADPDNNVCDGPSGGIPDRDAPVQSTGRDITHFAFTWDDTDLFIFTERAGSSSNVQRFIYYADTDNDSLMETGEPVIGVNWQGNTGLVEVYLFQYTAVAAGGDPLTDPNGSGDGYTLPGDFQNVPKSNQPTRTGYWGSSSNLQMEFRVTWAELGLASGTPFTFHVASSNTWFGSAGYASKIDDNLGGCGGGAGSTQFAALTFVPDVALIGSRGSTVYAAHTITNDGNGTDTFDLTSVIGGAHTPAVAYYLDADASGTFTVGDTLLTDTDGDTVPDTGAIAATATIDILIAYTIADNGPGDPSGVATIVTTATSSYEPLVTDSVTDTVTVVEIVDLLVMKTATTVQDPINGTTDPKAIPGAFVRYDVIVTNEGGVAVDTDTVSITDPIPVLGDLFIGDLGGAGSGPVVFVDGATSSGLTYTFVSLGDGGDDLAFSNDGGATFTYTPVSDGTNHDPNVTHIRIDPKGQFAAATVAGNPSFTVSFRVRVD
jgi:hypothetical protein